jgi:hypothetical protein
MGPLIYSIFVITYNREISVAVLEFIEFLFHVRNVTKRYSLLYYRNKIVNSDSNQDNIINMQQLPLAMQYVLTIFVR